MTALLGFRAQKSHMSHVIVARSASWRTCKERREEEFAVTTQLLNLKLVVVLLFSVHMYHCFFS